MPFESELKRALNSRRYREADIDWAEYVRPYGKRGLHIVTRRCNSQEIVVSSTVGDRTFKPGTQVPLGSHTATPGQFIIGLPPPGHIGISTYGVLRPPDVEIDAYGITQANPDTLESGTDDNAVTLYGFGFLASPVDTIFAVAYNESTKAWATDALITVHDVAYVASDEATCQIDVSASAPAGYRICLQMERT